MAGSGASDAAGIGATEGEPGSGTAGAVSRALTPEDLGLEGEVSELRGSYTVANGRLTIRIDMITGRLVNVGGNFLRTSLTRLIEVARAAGVSQLRIEGTFANESLMRRSEATLSREGYRACIESIGGSEYLEVEVR